MFTRSKGLEVYLRYKAEINDRQCSAASSHQRSSLLHYRPIITVSSIMQQLLRIIESDESGAVTATYESDKDSVSVCSFRFTTFRPGLSVADYSQQSQLQKAPPLKQVVNVFLPAGFPASVTEDYVGYAVLFFTRQLNTGPLSHTITSKNGGRIMLHLSKHRRYKQL